MSELLDKGLAELRAGNFTRLEELLRDNSATIFDILEKPAEDDLDEAFTWACMIGRAADAERLLDLGADPERGMTTGLAGAHYAASGAHVDVVRMLIRRAVPVETINMYGGTVLGQALWSAMNETRPFHPDVIEALVSAGAKVEEFMIDYWKGQDIPDKQYKMRILRALGGSLKKT